MTRLGLLLAAAAVTLTACSGAGGTPADAPASRSSNHFFGIVNAGPLAKSDVRKMKSTKVPTVRFLLSWPAVQPSRGTTSWTNTDVLVANFASRGITPFPFVNGSPRWVAPKTADPPIKNAHARHAWRHFLAAAVKRYGPGGKFWKKDKSVGVSPYHFICRCKARPVPIRAWQIWNEPNLKIFFNPKPSPRKYAKLVKISHSAIKSQDHHAKVILAGLPGFGDLYAWKFIDRLYRVHGIKRDFDAVSLHPYSRNVRQLKQELMRVRKVMNKHGDGKAPLWITEIGWGSAHPDGSLSKGLKGQKRALIKSFNVLLHLRQKRHIGRVFWYDWRDPPKSAPRTNCKFCPSAGLLRHNHKPKPAWHAYKRFTRG